MTDDDDLSSAFGSVFGSHVNTAAETARPGGELGAPTDLRPDAFDESKYLRVYPDVAAAVQAGTYASGIEHYQNHGRLENRLERLDYRHGWPIIESAGFPDFGIDSVIWTTAGQAMVVGWMDDADPKLSSVSLIVHETTLGVTSAIGRCRREDAEQKTGVVGARLLGFWAVFEARRSIRSDDVRVVVMTSDGQRSAPVQIAVVSDEQLRDRALEYLAHASYWGHPQVNGFQQLDAGLGDALVTVNRLACSSLAAQALCRRFGRTPKTLAGSFIVCLYGRLEYVFLQAALFTMGAGWEDYEFIYVCNSPELAEALMREAALAVDIYGVSITIVIMAGNAGFGVANNVAVEFARSSRILVVNPDVFPRQSDWATRHAQLVAGLPREQTRAFGVPLFYDDGSMMHGGMFFELDEALSLQESGLVRCELARVEHYGKGAPPDTRRFLLSRPVPAVTGAFISIDRDWYESLGGFSPAFVLGHYEDADLCLRSLQAGVEVWLHDIPFWHMEGKGSHRRATHEGASLVNRWQFTRRWADYLRADLLGPSPIRFSASSGAGGPIQ